MTGFSKGQTITIDEGADSETAVVSSIRARGASTITVVATAPVLGEASVIRAEYQVQWLELIRSLSVYAVEVPLFLLLSGLAFSLILFDRNDHVYLWMGAVFLLTAVGSTLLILSGWTQQLSIRTSTLLIDSCVAPLLSAEWVMVWWVWFGRQRRWITICSYELVPHSVAAAFGTVSLIIELLFFALLMWIVIQNSTAGSGRMGWCYLQFCYEELRVCERPWWTACPLRVACFGLNVGFPRSQLCQPF